jgi:hypothetical protein
MIRIRRRIAREEIDHLIQEDPFYQAEMADDEVIDCRALKFSPCARLPRERLPRNPADDGKEAVERSKPGLPYQIGSILAVKSAYARTNAKAAAGPKSMGAENGRRWWSQNTQCFKTRYQ